MDMKKYYSEDYRREVLELSDRHIDWDFGRAVKDESDIDIIMSRYYMACTMYKEAFEKHYHVKLWYCGRSGRHVCVDDTAVNRRRYVTMCDVVELMQKLIVFVATDNSAWLGDVFELFKGVPQWVCRAHREIKGEINARYSFIKEC